MSFLNLNHHGMVGGLIMQLKKLNRKMRKKESDKGQMTFRNVIGDYFVSSKEGQDRFTKIKKHVQNSR